MTRNKKRCLADFGGNKTPNNNNNKLKKEFYV